jgi:hypothetical protein
MASLEQRVKHLFPGKGRCLIETALVFAICHKRWLTMEDLNTWVNAGSKKFVRLLCMKLLKS